MAFTYILIILLAFFSSSYQQMMIDEVKKRAHENAHVSRFLVLYDFFFYSAGQRRGHA